MPQRWGWAGEGSARPSESRSHCPSGTGRQDRFRSPDATVGLPRPLPRCAGKGRGRRLLSQRPSREAHRKDTGSWCPCGPAGRRARSLGDPGHMIAEERDRGCWGSTGCKPAVPLRHCCPGQGARAPGGPGSPREMMAKITCGQLEEMPRGCVLQKQRGAQLMPRTPRTAAEASSSARARGPARC